MFNLNKLWHNYNVLIIIAAVLAVYVMLVNFNIIKPGYAEEDKALVTASNNQKQLPQIKTTIEKK